MAPATIAPISYTVTPLDLHAHLYQVELRIARAHANQTVSLPVWIPGSYLVREFSRHLQNVQARLNGHATGIRQLNKNTWQLDNAAGEAATLQYQVYAFDNSVRTAWLDADRAFFNPTSLCLRVHGQEGERHALRLSASDWPGQWQLATALRPVQTDAAGFGLYEAQDYDELADSPVEAGTFWHGEFVAHGVPHRLVVAGATATFDGARLLADTQRICEAEMRFWHADGSAPAHDRYVFMLNAVGNGYGGLEHRHSTALIAKREDLPRLGADTQPDGYRILLGLVSHEYFHTWNVKRMRPAEFAHYDYERENYTELLWFFEGFTSYYDDLLLRRAGLLNNAQYLIALGKTIQNVSQTPGTAVQTVAQASFDAWVKYYRQDENTANATVSYYTKGALVALCLDLTLRSEGRTTLDAVMRHLWQNSQAGPITQADVLAALQQLGGRSYAAEINDWVHSTKPLPVQQLLVRHGVKWLNQEAKWDHRLGVVVTDKEGLSIRRILRGSVAEKAGFAVGDEWLAIEVQGQSWRIRKLSDLTLVLPESEAGFSVLIARDGRVLRIPVVLDSVDETPGEVLLSVGDEALVSQWLSEA